MIHKTTQSNRILALAPAAKGLGFAVLDDGERFADYGVKTIKGSDKNGDTLAKAEKLMAFFLPTLLVLQDTAAEGSRRHARIRELTDQLVALAKKRKVKVKLYSRAKMMRAFFPEGKGNIQELAELLGQRFPEDLQVAVPERRNFWENKDQSLVAFEAIALAVLPSTKMKN